MEAREMETRERLEEARRDAERLREQASRSGVHLRHLIVARLLLETDPLSVLTQERFSDTYADVCGACDELNLFVVSAIVAVHRALCSKAIDGFPG